MLHTSNAAMPMPMIGQHDFHPLFDAIEAFDFNEVAPLCSSQTEPA